MTKRRPLLFRAGVAALVALAFNALVRIVVRAAARVPDAFDPFTWPPIVVATIVGVAGGTLVYIVLRKFFDNRADGVFIWSASIVLVLSLITPITLLWTQPPQYPGTTLLTVAALELMHISTGVATIIALARPPR